MARVTVSLTRLAKSCIGYLSILFLLGVEGNACATESGENLILGQWF
jgi:hypothetical protein